MDEECNRSLEEDKKNGVCRVCLCYNGKESSKWISLFEKYNDGVISDQINALANVAIQENDGLPDMICQACLLELESAFKFKLKCESSNKILLSAVIKAPVVQSQIESLDVTLPMKEEYLEDVDYDNDRVDDIDYVDDHITLAELQASGALIKPLVDELVPPKPSKAIDLKLICDDCGGSFKSKCKLRVHWKNVHLTEKLKCLNCLRRFKSFAAFNTHKKGNSKSCATASKVRIEGEGRNRIFHCRECNYKSRRIKDISTHMVIHSGERPYQCDICLRCFTQQSSVQAHKEGAHKIYEVEATCQYCGKHIQGRNKFYRHMKQHKHTRFPCKVCSSVLKSKEGLQNHMRRHSGIKSYSCEVCPTSFFTASELSNHKTKVHLKSRFYVCQICNYKSFSHGAIVRHQPKHSPTNVACNICGMFLDNEQQLFLHKKRHTDRHYKCPHCEKNYYSRKNLGSHVRKKHRFVKLSGSTPRANSVKSECSVEIVPCRD